MSCKRYFYFLCVALHSQWHFQNDILAARRQEADGPRLGHATLWTDSSPGRKVEFFHPLVSVQFGSGTIDKLDALSSWPVFFLWNIFLFFLKKNVFLKNRASKRSLLLHWKFGKLPSISRWLKDTRLFPKLEKYQIHIRILDVYCRFFTNGNFFVFDLINSETLSNWMCVIVRCICHQYCVSVMRSCWVGSLLVLL